MGFFNFLKPIENDVGKAATGVFNFLKPVAVNTARLPVQFAENYANTFANLGNKAGGGQNQTIQQNMGGSGPLNSALKFSQATGTNRQLAGDVAQAGLFAVGGEIAKPAAALGTGIIGAVAPEAATRAIQGAVVKTALGVGGKLLPKGIDAATSIAAGTAGGAAIGGPQGVAQVAGSNEKLNAGNLTMGFLKGAGTGAVLGGAGSTLAEGAKNAIPLTEVGSIGKNVPAASDIHIPVGDTGTLRVNAQVFSNLAKATDATAVKNIIGNDLPKNIVDNVAPKIALTNSPDVISNILSKSLSPTLDKSPALASTPVSDITNPAGQGSSATSVTTPATTSDITNQRGFLNTVASSDNEQASNVAGQIQPQTYPTLPNAQSFKAANNFIDKNGIEAAHKYLLNDNTPFNAAKSGLGQLLQQKYSAEGDIGRLSEVMDAMDNQARVAGQGLQMLSNWSKLSPEAMFKLANTEADKFGTKLSPDFQQSILRQMKDVQNLPEGSQARAEAMQGVLKSIADNLPTTKSEWLSNYRYQNMLSSPTSAEKIGYGGLVNTLITHPVDLFANATVQAVQKGFNSSFDRTVAYSDIPQYYKDIAIGMPNAWQAAVNSFRSGNMTNTFEEGGGGAGTINKIRQSNIPTPLRPFTSLHGAIYKYFSSLVAGGERARLMSHGLSEADANKAAAALGDKLTLRSPLGSGTGSPAVQAVDAIGNFTTKLNDIPVLDVASKWIAPFMKVSTNWAKLAVEHSPLNIIDNPKNITSDQVAKAFVGSVATGIGLNFAMQGRTTWAPPTDPKQRDLWYASGRKPYSVEIGGKWVPMTTFGPLALAFGLPTAIRDATQNQNKYQPDFNKIVKVGTNTSQFIVNSTPLPSIAGFFNLLSGDTSVKPAKIGADVASQAIPLEALQRFVSNAMDTTNRKASTFTQRVESGIPGLSQNLPAYKTPLGKPETRNISNFVLPYAYGQGSSTYENALKGRQRMLNNNARMNSLRKAVTGG